MGRHESIRIRGESGGGGGGGWWNLRPHALDLRSLKLLRILLGCNICYDVVTRLQPFSYSIYWYISTPEEYAFLDPNDTPHRSAVHRLWFFRGSPAFELLMFGLVFVLGAAFGIGRLSKIWYLQVLLWILVVAMQNRNMNVHDGSDNFGRQMLLWFILIPTSVQSRINTMSFRSRQPHPVSCVAFSGLIIQIALMYLGTVAQRSIDNFADPNYEFHWLPPKLDAVYFIVRDAFAIREDSIIIRVARSLPLWCIQIMTAAAMVGETSVVGWMLLPPNSPWRFGAFVSYFNIHLGMLLMMRLPNWQLLAMSVSTVWIPGCIWDKIATGPPPVAHKKDDDAKRQENLEEMSKAPAQPSVIRRGVTYFLLSYMIYNWCGERGWIPKLDGGDVGEFLRISQYWVMYSTPPKERCVPNMIQKNYFSDNDTVVTYDAMKGIRTGRWDLIDESIPLETFISPRWERALDKCGRGRNLKRAKRLLKGLCSSTKYVQSTIGAMQTPDRRVLRLEWNCDVILPPSDRTPHKMDSGRDTFSVGETCE